MTMTHYPDGSPALIRAPHPVYSHLRHMREADPRKFKIYRNRRGWPCWYQRWLEAWWIVTGSWSLHRAWQDGKDYGTRMEYQRTVVNGGR